MTSLEFTGTGTCTDCGATWKTFSTGSFRINRGSLVSTGSVLTLTQGGCDHPAPPIRLRPDPASRDRINAARAKRGWPPLDDPTEEPQP